LSDLEEIKNHLGMNIKSGHVMIKVECRDRLLKIIENQQEEIERLTNEIITRTNNPK
jgi:hypothetical protein